jgi:hypothetical protein
VSNETVHHAPGNDASQDPAQPPVGPAIQFEKLVVPDDDPSVEVPTGPPGELIDQRRAELEAEANGK